MHCPICYELLPAKHKKQINHLITHSPADMIESLLFLQDRVTVLERAVARRAAVEPGATYGETLALDDHPDVFSLVEVSSEEVSEEVSDQDMERAGFVQCAHCGLWLWPDDMPTHLNTECPELHPDPPATSMFAASALHNHMQALYPGSDPVAPLAPTVEHDTDESFNPFYPPGAHPADPVDLGRLMMRITADGAEAMLLNALADFVFSLPRFLPPGKPYLQYRYYKHAPETDGYYTFPADSADMQVLNALALYTRRSMGNG